MLVGQTSYPNSNFPRFGGHRIADLMKGWGSSKHMLKFKCYIRSLWYRGFYSVPDYVLILNWDFVIVNSNKEVFFESTSYSVPTFLVCSILVIKQGCKGLPIMIIVGFEDGSRVFKYFPSWKDEGG